MKAGTRGVLPIVGRVFLAQATAGLGDRAGARRWMEYARAQVSKEQARTLLPVLVRLERELGRGAVPLGGAGVSS